MNSTSAPIGIFDSGVGGLTVLEAMRERMPDENYLYLGDTARVPYGPKSPETVRRYAREAAGFLHDRGIKALVIACNTATAHARRDLDGLRGVCCPSRSPGHRTAAPADRSPYA